MALLLGERLMQIIQGFFIYRVQFLHHFLMSNITVPLNRSLLTQVEANLHHRSAQKAFSQLSAAIWSSPERGEQMKESPP
jgi:hypothetical protein